MLTARAISVTGIILGSSLVAVAIAGEVTDCQTSVTRNDGDLAHWSWRTIDGRQCWYRGARWKPKHELRWTDATPSVAGQPEIDNRADGLGAESGRPADNSLTGLEPGPMAPRSIDNASEESGFSLGRLEGVGDIWNVPPVNETFNARYGRW
jgi:hypothetical protein